MTCPRCLGLLIPELPLYNQVGPDDTDIGNDADGACRCVACGWYADRVMLANREKAPKTGRERDGRPRIPVGV